MFGLLSPWVAAVRSCEVCVVGGGPAGYAIAAQLANNGNSVALIDQSPNQKWPNNYGAWKDEWDALAQKWQHVAPLHKCVKQQWEVTDCYFGGSFGKPDDLKTRLQRAYLQVDRVALKQVLTDQLLRSDQAEILQAKLDATLLAPNLFDRNLDHDAHGSTLTLSDGTELRAKLIVDASGSESRLVQRESFTSAGYWRESQVGYQIAYGMTVDTPQGHEPYAAEAMTLFDYRTDHLISDKSWLADAEERPSFLYAMPFPAEKEGDVAHIFFEETSLVGRGSRRLEFEQLKRRLIARLKHLGIKYDPESVRDEEFCYIPMGGALPDASQRVIPFGGAAATVHPSTGYQLCRMLASCEDLIVAISASLEQSDDEFNADAAAASAHEALWPRSARLQRDFQVFGGEFLQQAYVETLRGFFDGFFALEAAVWGGFLAGWKGLPGNDNHAHWDKRLLFGLSIFAKFPPKVSLGFLAFLARYTAEFGPVMLRSIATPLFDFVAPPVAGVADYRARTRSMYVEGDQTAKSEAVSMLRGK